MGRTSKRGIATMPVSNPQTIAQYSLQATGIVPLSYHPINPSPPWISHHGCWKAPFPKSNLNSEMIPFPHNTSTISQTPSGPSILMVYYTTSDTSMFQTPAIWTMCFFSTRMTTPLQVISVRRRPYIKSICNTIGLDFQSMSRTTANRAPLVPAPNLCATNPMDFSSNFWFLRSLGIPYPWIS